LALSIALISCAPPKVYTILNASSEFEIDSITIYTDINDQLSNVRMDILVELKSQFFFNGIKSTLVNFDSSSSLDQFSSGYELLISEEAENRIPLFLDFGFKSGWAWPGSILGRSFKFRANLMYEGYSIWVGDVYSSYDRVLAEKIIGEGISRRFLKGMEKQELLPERFSLVKYTLKYDYEDELYSDKR
tara:strand:- start:12757 stop:13323 length:567 start_codon:yes stop_codon:yes gene_type:complete